MIFQVIKVISYFQDSQCFENIRFKKKFKKNIYGRFKQNYKNKNKKIKLMVMSEHEAVQTQAL